LIMKKICFIVVNHLGFQQTIEMYKSLLVVSDNHDKFDFIVVDNSLDENESNRLDIFFESSKNVKLIYSECNEGYFAGLNLGLGACDVEKYKYVCIGNNDLVFDKLFLDSLKGKIFSKDVFVVCPDIVTVDGFHQNPHVVKRVSKIRKLKLDIYYTSFFVANFLLVVQKFLMPRRPNKKSDSPQYIHMGIGAFYILTSEFFKNNTKLEYPFFLYGEEAFLSAQVIKSDGKIYYDPDLVVYHEESASLSKTPSLKRYNWSKESYRVHRDFL